MSLEVLESTAMKVTRKSGLSGITRTKILDITSQQMFDYEIGGKLVQHAFPHLSASDREFIMTGICDGEWEELFGTDED